MKYRLVQVALLVPSGDDSWRRAINDYGMDYPDQLAAFAVTAERPGESMDAATAEAVWKNATGKNITLTEDE